LKKKGHNPVLSYVAVESVSFEAGKRIASLLIYGGLAPARDLSVMLKINSLLLASPKGTSRGHIP
jgi:hypothetical protein